MKTFLELQTQVRDILDDTTIKPSEYINLAINHISNFFQNLVILEFTPTEDSHSIPTPDNLYKIDNISVNETSIKKLDDLDKIDYAKENNVMLWYYLDNKIYFTFQVKTSDTVDIIYKKTFSELNADNEITDVPDTYETLLILCAVWLYYKKINAAVETNREKYSDVNPDESRRLRDTAKSDFDDVMMNLLLNA